MDLAARTLDALDWPVLVDALSTHARTAMGRRAVRALVPHQRPEDARVDFDAIEEVRLVEDEGGHIPVGAVSDIGDIAKRAAQGQVLEPESLRAAGSTLVGLRLLHAVLFEESDRAPTLFGMAQAIDIDGWVADELDKAFDATGQLSAETYPELGELRKVIGDLHETIRRTLDEMIKGDSMADLLQDRFVTQRGDRYVIPIKAHAKNWDLGIVHGTSGSGRTVFVEPKEVIALNNRLRIAEGELEAAEHRILQALSSQLGRIAPKVHAALEAATELDLACAREGFARELRASRPIVRGEGVIDLKRARHPVLHLRGVKVVPNDLSVTPSRPTLVLTGPNTGGKTVALKTIGLCALLARIGCFIPAEEESRIDLFAEILADIGDTQTVREDLSSFSGHLVVLREMLGHARPGCLYLLDELCSGTDPGQGGALARAVLEELLERGPRVVATTHYAQLKGLASVDPRFGLAAMEYADGRPTYRVVHDATGESHALDTALRMGLDPELIARARGLMGETERAFHDAIGALEAERDRARHEAEQARTLAATLAERERAVAEREAALRTRSKELEEKQAARFVERLKQAEKAISAVVTDLQRTPDHRRVEAARATVEALRGLVPTPEEAPVEAPTLAPGDRVKLRKLGQQGEVLTVGDVVQVRVGAVTVKVRPEDLERTEGAPMPAPAVPRVSVETVKRPALDQALRIPGNTVDLRGMRVDEAFDVVDRFFAQAGARHGVVFLLHGHGTGALKDGVRRWLPEHPAVRDWAPANADQGGDAFTVVAIG